MPSHTDTRLTALCVAALAAAGVSVAALGDIALQPKAGQPLDGLSPAELARFVAGKSLFQTVLAADQGLGPIFTSPACSSCHNSPVGGWGDSMVTRFGYVDEEGFDPLTHLGGPVLQPNGVTLECFEEVPPPDVSNIITQRVTNSSMAFGLVEAIRDEAILALEDPSDRDGDGISGRAHMVPLLEACLSTPEGPDCTDAPLRVGRFGWKAQIATVLGFSADAARTEMGLTNRIFPVEHAPNGDPDLLAYCDSVPDPEDGPDAQGLDFIDRVTDFQRFLGPPPQTPRSGMTGEAIFHAIGCAACHVAEWTTPDDPSLEPVLRGRTIRPYTDFLLHDMGVLGDGFVDGDAQALEMRTPALWNLATRDPMLHDGRTSGGSFFHRVAGPGGAIWWHDVEGSEAKGAASAFFALPMEQQELVVSFLESLGRLEFDANRDRQIRYVDFLDFMACYDAGAEVSPDDPCAVHDIDQNGAVDLTDFAWFLEAYESPNGDCDGDGTTDLEEILLGAPDADGDGVPDACSAACSGDLDRDGVVGGSDLGALIAAWSTTDPAADLDGSGLVDEGDLGLLFAAWGGCP